MHAVSEDEERKQAELKCREGYVGRNDEGWSRTWSEDGAEEVGHKGRHNEDCNDAQGLGISNTQLGASLYSCRN